MKKLRSLRSGASRSARDCLDSRNNSLDTTSSMGTDLTANTNGEISSLEFPDCPFLHHA